MIITIGTGGSNGLNADAGPDARVGCQPDTVVVFCGDCVVWSPTEECDAELNLSQYGGCAPGCRLGPFCGDGRVQSQWEECDDGVNAGGYGKCGLGCRYGDRCGDGILQPAYEECDEGTNNGHGTCLQNCKIDRIL